MRPTTGWGEERVLRATGGIGVAHDETSGMTLTPALEAEAERLLEGRARDIRFSTEMNRAYRTKTWRQRSKIARAWMVWVALISMAFVPISYLLAPASLWLSGIISGLLVPALHACAYLVWRKPRGAGIEGLSLLLLMTSLMIAYGSLAVDAGGSDYERYLICILYANTVAIVVFHVEYAWSLSLMICTTAIFFGFEMFNPAVDYKEAIGVSVFYAMGIFAATTGRKTQTLLSKRAFLMSLRDAYRSAALKKANQKLEILATRDPLTGLANRRSAAEFTERLWRDQKVPKACIAFVMADIDSFKKLNDSAGHAAGDACIQQVAGAIAQSVRSGDDAVFRYGGEEFLIVLTNASFDLAWTIAERIRRGVEALALVNPGLTVKDGSAGFITISLGVAFAQDDVAPELVIHWADDALYDAKRSGKNVVLVSAAHSAPVIAFSSEVGTGSRQENASNQESSAQSGEPVVSSQLDNSDPSPNIASFTA
jgi:diguanylate cyclase (GGDEF)-like protein